MFVKFYVFYAACILISIAVAFLFYSVLKKVAAKTTPSRTLKGIISISVVIFYAIYILYIIFSYIPLFREMLGGTLPSIHEVLVLPVVVFLLSGSFHTLIYSTFFIGIAIIIFKFKKTKT